MVAAEIGLIGRVLFGALLAFTGVNHFQNVDAMTGYAEHKGVPLPRVGVVGSGVVLVGGGLGVAAGVAPVLSAGALAVFLVAAAVLFHDFWAVSEEEKQNEMNHFIKNVAMAGGALAFLAAGPAVWTHGVGLGVF
ncbi:MAG: DoxX family membrane protein [Haloferacaceae archaeon]